VYTQFPYQQLTKLGTDLETLSGELKQDHHGARDVEGLDSEDHANVIAAVQGFQDEWETSLLDLMTNVGETGTLTKQIGQVVEQSDSGLASQFGKH
jgi:hypothetical protein